MDTASLAGMLVIIFYKWCHQAHFPKTRQPHRTGRANPLTKDEDAPACHGSDQLDIEREQEIQIFQYSNYYNLAIVYSSVSETVVSGGSQKGSQGVPIKRKGSMVGSQINYIIILSQ